MTWETIRAHYAALLVEARRKGLTQDAIAQAGQLPGQNAISKLLRNQNLGPSVETFIKAVRGLGKDVSTFFAEIEQGGSIASAPPEEKSLADRIRDLEVALEALASVAVPPSSPVSSSPSVISHGLGVEAAPSGPAHGRSHGANSLSGSGVVNNISTLDLRQIEAVVRPCFEQLGDRLERLAADLVARRPPGETVHAKATSARAGRRRRARKTA